MCRWRARRFTGGPRRARSQGTEPVLVGPYFFVLLRTFNHAPLCDISDPSLIAAWKYGSLCKNLNYNDNIISTHWKLFWSKENISGGCHGGGTQLGPTAKKDPFSLAVLMHVSTNIFECPPPTPGHCVRVFVAVALMSAVCFGMLWAPLWADGAWWWVLFLATQDKLADTKWRTKKGTNEELPCNFRCVA